MSLTSRINQSGSDIRQFYAQHLPQLPKTSRGLNKELGRHELKADGSLLTRYEKTVAGGAIDYRARMVLDPGYNPRVLEYGAGVMGKRWLGKNGIYKSLLAYLARTTHELRLCQIAIIFAYLDGCYRSSMESETLKEIGSRNIERMLDRLNPVLVDDVTAQRQILGQRSFIANSKDVVLEPTFDGSDDVGNADADIIVDGMLIDFKSTAKCKLTSAILRQLIGYWLLDYSDQYAVKRVGVYFTRYGEFWSIDVAELLSLCGFASDRGLRDLWKEALRRQRIDRSCMHESGGWQAEIVESLQQRPVQTKEEAREKRKLSESKRRWRLAGAAAVLVNPATLKKWQIRIIAKFASCKTDYRCSSGLDRALLDKEVARALMPFDDWHRQFAGRYDSPDPAPTAK